MVKKSRKMVKNNIEKFFVKNHEKFQNIVYIIGRYQYNI